MGVAKTPHRHRTAALVLLTLAPAAASATPAYSIQPLPTPADQSTFYAHSINSSGVVVGDLYDRGYVISPTRADVVAIGTRGTPQYLEAEIAWRINDAGTITGETTDGPNRRYTYITSPTSTDLLADATVGGYTYVQDMNNAGAIVGDYYVPRGDDAGTHAFLYADHTFVRLGSLQNTSGLYGPNYSIATAINDAGLIAGQAQAPDGSAPAFLYRDGQLVSLGTPAGYSSALPRAINNAGTIVGEASDSFDPDAPPSTSAFFLYANDHYTLIASPGGRIMPLDINSAGNVVGIYHYDDSTHPRVPFLYHDGTLSDLNAYIDPTSGWTLTNALALNDSGQILAVGTYQGQQRTVILNPLPEPSTFLLLALIPMTRRRPRRQI